jgi:MFS family permease
VADAKARPQRSVLGLVFLTAFLDLAGFSIIFPLFPAMLEYYAGAAGSHTRLGEMVAMLREYAGESPNAELLVYALFGGVLGSLYSILQFVFAPIWGALSDRFGRRPTLLVTLFGTMISYVVWFFAGTFTWLIAARLLGGVMAGNISTASAVVADTTTPADRSKGMGMMGAAIGLGFIFGPAIGGQAAKVDLSSYWPEAASMGVNAFSFAAAVAFVLALINFLWALVRFPETHPPEKRGRGRGERTANPLSVFTAVRSRGVPRANLVYFLFFLAFSAVEFTLVFLAVERFAYSPHDNAWMFVFVGVLIALVQGGLVRRLAPRFGDRRLTWVGVLMVLPGFVLIGLAASEGRLYGGLALMAVGSALTMPCLSSLVSRYAPADRQGLALGTFRSAGALSRAFGPVLGGLLYWKLGSASPFLIGAGFLLLPLGVALGLPKAPDEPTPGPE